MIQTTEGREKVRTYGKRKQRVQRLVIYSNSILHTAAFGHGLCAGGCTEQPLAGGKMPNRQKQNKAKTSDIPGTKQKPKAIHLSMIS